MFGIKLSKNFGHPYFAKTMPEFWRRWHASLGGFFRDYVYIPLGGGRVRKVRKMFNIMAVWFLTGLWHGASWNFIAWGLFHGIVIVFGNLFRDVNKKLTSTLKIDAERFGWKLWQMLRTFAIARVSRVFFRADTFESAIGIFRNTFKAPFVEGILGANLYTYGLDAYNFWFAILSIAILWVVDMLQERMCIRDTLAKQNMVFRWIIIYAGLFAVLIFGMYGPGFNAQDFIYGQF